MNTILKEEMSAYANLPKIIESYISNIPEAEIDLRRGKDAWTIREHIYHLVEVQKMLLGRIQIIKESPAPVIEPYFPDGETDLGRRYESVKEAFKEYKKLRKEQIRLINKCTQRELKRSAFHKEYRHYSIPKIVKHSIFHEYWHMYRIEELWLTRDEYFK